jgi:hypothetical protein
VEGKMSEEKRPTTFETAQDLTGTEVGTVLEDVGAVIVCESCERGKYEVGCMGPRAVPVALPIPPENEQALWFFTAICSNCGHTRFYFAPFIAQKIIEKRGSNSDK